MCQARSPEKNHMSMHTHRESDYLLHNVPFPSRGSRLTEFAAVTVSHCDRCANEKKDDDY
jgi:hypothetical protein